MLNALTKHSKFFSPLGANPTKRSNTFRQFVGNLPAICLSVFDNFVGLALKQLINEIIGDIISNINEAIRSLLNFLIFFLQKDFKSTKKHKTAYSEQKFKNVYKKHLSSNINEVIKAI